MNMKLIFPVLFLLIPHLTNGQWVWAPLDSGQVPASGYWDEMPGYYWELNSSRMMVSEASDSIDGHGALRFSYRIFPINSWGDYAPVRHTVSPSFNPVSGYDLSNSRYLSFWIKNTKPGKLTAPGKLVFDFSLLTLNGTGFTLKPGYRFLFLMPGI